MSIEVARWPIEDVVHIDLMLNHMRIMTKDSSSRVEADAWREIDRLLDNRNVIVGRVALEMLVDVFGAKEVDSQDA